MLAHLLQGILNPPLGNLFDSVYISAGQAEIFIPPNHVAGEVHPLLIYA